MKEHQLLIKSLSGQPEQKIIIGELITDIEIKSDDPDKERKFIKRYKTQNGKVLVFTAVYEKLTMHCLGKLITSSVE